VGIRGYCAVHLCYNPRNVEIDIDPCAVQRRLQDDAPLYDNDRHDFWGLSRYVDVDAVLRDPKRLSPAKGDILEVVQSVPVMPPAGVIDEDRSNGPLRNLYVVLSGGRLCLAIGWDGQ
jgi:hypothetical protein